MERALFALANKNRGEDWGRRRKDHTSCCWGDPLARTLLKVPFANTVMGTRVGWRAFRRGGTLFRQSHAARNLKRILADMVMEHGLDRTYLARANLGLRACGCQQGGSNSGSEKWTLFEVRNIFQNEQKHMSEVEKAGWEG